MSSDVSTMYTGRTRIVRNAAIFAKCILGGSSYHTNYFPSKSVLLPIEGKSSKDIKYKPRK